MVTDNGVDNIKCMSFWNYYKNCIFILKKKYNNYLSFFYRKKEIKNKNKNNLNI